MEVGIMDLPMDNGGGGKPMLMQPRKRTPKKPSRDPATQCNVRRIRSYDVVTRIPADRVHHHHPMTDREQLTPGKLRTRSSSQEPFLSLAPTASLVETHKGHRAHRQQPETCAPEVTTSNEHARPHQSSMEIEVYVSEEKVNIRQMVKHRSSDIPFVEGSDACGESATESSALNRCGPGQPENYLTLTGTIKRGKKAGQSIDIAADMSREELDELESSLAKKLENPKIIFGLKSGLHILLLTIFCIPGVFIAASGYTFYLGTLTWYNMYLHFSEERTLCHKVFVCPVLILSYPFVMLVVVVGVGIYAAMIQLSWYFDVWINEIQDLEKGFYGWLCAVLQISECSPYEVVVLNDAQVNCEQAHINLDTNV